MHRVGASPRTIKTALSLLSLVQPMLCCQLALCCVSFAEHASLPCLGYIFFAYVLLTTALSVSRIRRKALKYTVYRLRESSLLQSVLSGVHTALCGSLCTPLVLLLLVLFCCLDFSFCNGHVILEK